MRWGARGLRLLLCVLPGIATASLPLCSQTPRSDSSPADSFRLALGFGVDTTRSPAREIYHLWRSYLASHPETGRPTPSWSRAEQAKYPDYDILRSLVHQGFRHFTVVHLAPSPGLPGTYELRTLVSSVSRITNDVQPLALFRVYATREDGRWVLGNALPRLTRDWKRELIGHVTFIAHPGYRFDAARARRASDFLDSLANAYSVPQSAIEYYLSPNLSETFRALGLDYFPLGPDTSGGRALASNRIVLVGAPTEAEENHHELAHIVFAALTIPQTHRLVVEGLATWAGGSAGLSFPGLVPGLRYWLEKHPSATLRDILLDPPIREETLDVGYDALAIVCDMVFDRGGIRAIRELARAGPTADDVMRAVSRLVGMPAKDVEMAWKRRLLGTFPKQ
jgi:hypothetical protein